jgi:hypothetical protein
MEKDYQILKINGRETASNTETKLETKLEKSA